jgi:hypothetical protein
MLTLRTILAALLPFVFALAVADAIAAPRKAAAPAQPAQEAPAREKIAYENLHGYLGDRITVHTTYKTTRTGVLARFSQSELTLTIDTPGGETELTIPKNTIADIVPAPAGH